MFEILSKIYVADLSAIDRYGHGIPPEVLEIARTALSRHAQDRFASAASFAIAIQSVIDRLGLSTGPAELVSWLAALGMLPSRSGTMQAQRVEDYDPGRSKDAR